MSTLVDRLVPARLGPDVRRLVGATWLGQLADGMAMVAGPLAVASLTASPFLVAVAVALHRLPVLLAGPYAAFLADLVNRRLLVVGADLVRAAVLALVALLLALGAASLSVLLVVMVVLGGAETLADAARGPVLPMLVDQAHEQDTVGARLDGGFVAGTQLVGPALGAALFAVGRPAPFLVQTLLVAAAAAAFARIRLAGPSRGPAPVGERRPVRTGLRRIAVDPALSGLVLSGLAAQAAWAGGWALLVVYAKVQLGLGPTGFGLLVATAAVGGMVGVAVRPLVGWLTHRVRAVTPGRIVLAGLGLEASGQLTLARLHDRWGAAATVAALAAVGFVAGDVARELRRARTAGEGAADAVAAATATLGLAAAVAGCLAGGLLAALGGIAAAYVGGAAVLGLALILLFRRVVAL
ncbi:MFS transporter [Nocardioides jiangxiensis]|uniref:MFS transporter n=1 Tax=Nocardioides jiangxiensis TaxID=3064524 RepID=A0ABT9B4J4_9ACTN|nr:MFS transporter [Nocardioides sp. WY-20]MDO7869173.1 MFS transporter [Nocardioides sp. WY-20]